jgi:hypothetical protein
MTAYTSSFERKKIMATAAHVMQRYPCGSKRPSAGSNLAMRDIISPLRCLVTQKAKTITSPTDTTPKRIMMLLARIFFGNRRIRAIGDRIIVDACGLPRLKMIFSLEVLQVRCPRCGKCFSVCKPVVIFKSTLID